MFLLQRCGYLMGKSYCHEEANWILRPIFRLKKVWFFVDLLGGRRIYHILMMIYVVGGSTENATGH
jgi:hypothetical protein